MIFFRWLSLILAALALIAPAIGACPAIGAETSADLSDELHLEHYSVRLDGVVVAADATVYRADDHTIYVSSAQLDAWGLKRPLKPAFDRDGQSYYGLQTDLTLATSFDRDSHELDIVARKSAFIGQPNTALPPISPGNGLFMNYYLSKESGSYDLFSAAGNGVFEQRYLSTTGEDGLEFHRSRTRWFQLNPVSHTVLQLGDGTTDGGWIGTSAPFAGVHFASDYTSDPTYVQNGPPSVSGVAASPSQLEVYVDNVLELRRDVPQGPFTVRDLPSSAAHSDIVMVLTDADGKRTFQVARPTYNPDFLGQRMTTFSVDAGLGHSNVDLKHSYYSGGVFEGTLRYGITSHITGEFHAESIAGENFADAGADFALTGDDTFDFRIGDGNKRRASQFEYNLRRRGFRFREQLTFNSLQAEPFLAMDFGDTIAQISESSELGVDFNRNVSLTLRLDRSRDNTGFNSSMLSARTRYRNRALTVEINPLYDFVRRRMSANIGLTFRVSPDERIIERSAVTAQGQKSAAIEYRKDSNDPSDPISIAAKISAGRTQDRRFYINDDMPWASASFNYQQLNRRSIYEPEIYGALAFAGNRLYTLRTVGDSESFGVLHIPGLRNVRVSVNSSDVGRTNSRGDLMLRDLAPFRDNAIGVSTEDIPLDVNILDPKHVVPARSSPLSLTIPIASRGGFTLNAVDERGAALEPGGELQSTDGRYPIGYNGRTYVTGLAPGPQRLMGSANGVPCTIAITVPANLDQIPDLGRQICHL
jgi:outer membrane usher protein